LVIIILGLAGCATRLATSTDPVPPTLDGVMDDRFPGWTIAPFAGDAACQTAAGSSPSIVAGDFDSDGRSDRALLIETPQGRAVVVALRMLDTFRVWVVDTSTAGGSTVHYLRLEPRGQRYPSGIEGVTDYLANETVAAATCGATERVAFAWTGSGFRRVVLGAPAAGAGTRP
jgi:hypothetical protein